MISLEELVIEIVSTMRSLSEIAALDYGEVANGDGGDGGADRIVGECSATIIRFFL